MYNFLRKLTNPKSKNEDIARREHILNILLVGSAIPLTLLLIPYFIKYTYYTLNNISSESMISPIIIVIFVFFFWVLLFLSKRGFHRIVAYIFTGILFFFAFYLSFKWGIELSAGVLFYVMVIVMSSILISTRFSFFVAFIVSVTLFMVGYLQINNIISTELTWRNGRYGMEDIGVYAIIFIIITVVAWLSNREIEKSLKRARRSEANLKAERDMLEEKVEERTRELKKIQMGKVAQLYRLAEFGKLTSGIFHDMMSPLTVASLNIEKLENTKSEEIMQAKKHLTETIKATKRLEAFITAIRKQVTKQQHRVTFLISKEIQQTMQLLMYKAHKVNVELKFMPKAEIFTFGDSVGFCQAMLNLIANAIDAYNDIGKDIQTRREVIVNTSEENGFIYITVEDWGAGIDEAIIDKIFEPFFTTKEFETGTGIGLSLTKSIIEKDFKGTIKVQSKKGVGSKFIIKISKQYEDKG